MGDPAQKRDPVVDARRPRGWHARRREPLLSPERVAALLQCTIEDAESTILSLRPIRVGRLLRIERWVLEQAHPHLRVSAKRRSNGFTAELLIRLRDHQAGRCAICPVELTKSGMGRESADHCHVTGRPRGLLCAACNYALGFYEKSQRPAGLRIEVYDRYLDEPPTARWPGAVHVGS